MTLVSLHEHHIPTLYTIYRQQTARAAHCRFAPSLLSFHNALLQPSKPQTRFLVAEEHGVANGFAAFLPLTPAEDGTTRATISALFAEDDNAAQALIEASIRLAREGGFQRLGAFSANHFNCPVPGYNVGWDALSDTMPAVARLLTRNGFRPTYRELLLSCDLRRFPPDPLSPPAGITLEQRVPEEGGWKLVASLDGRSAGSCSYSTLDRVVDDPAATGVGYVWGIGVAETARRRGIARYLMNQLLVHLQALGCEECWLGTGATNFPAQPLYLSLGFEIVDATASFETILDG